MRSIPCCLAMIVGCQAPPDERATDPELAVELGQLATPHLALDNEGTTTVLRFTTFELLENPTWQLQRRAAGGGSWQPVTTSGARYPLTGVPTGTQFRLGVCVGSRCSATSPPVTVSIPPGTTNPTLTPSWGNPAAAQTCPAEPVVPASHWVGTLAGTAGVSSGDATYTIPIEVPPGRGGMQPAIALVYDSGAGAGIAGQGWSLSATSSIHRCERIEALDRDTRPVTITGIDRLCLDGSPLVLATGSYGTSGATYRAELAKHDRITQAGVLGGTQTCFTIETKAGLRRKYGKCDGINGIATVTIPGAGTHPMSWSLVRDEDRQGNTVDYEYAVQSGQHVLVAIRYTGRAGQPPPTTERRVAFSYADRPDQVIGFRYRNVTEQASRRLTAITTYVNQAAARRYELDYKQSFSTRRSLLTAVRMCAGAGPCAAATSVPATTFLYNESTPHYTRERVALPDQALAQAHVYGDYDGDGVRDKLIVTRAHPWGGGVTDATLELSGYGTPNPVAFVVGGVTQPVLPGFAPRMIGATLPRAVDLDFDQDGRTDLMGEDSMNMVAFASWNTATGAFQLRQTNVAAFDETGAVPGQLLFEPHDFNGDGKTDLYARQTRTMFLQCRDPNPDGAIVFCNEIVMPLLPGPSSCRQVMDIRDWNGDGLPDFLIEVGNIPGCQAGPTTILTSRGQFVITDMLATYELVDHSATFPFSIAGPSSRNQFADVNGDGLTDIVRATQPVPALYINRGGVFWSYPIINGRINFGSTPWTEQTWNAPSTLGDAEDTWGKLGEHAQVADFDNDGIDELMVPVEITVGACTLVNRPTAAESCLLSAIGNASADTSSRTWSLASGQSPNSGDHCYQEAYYEGAVVEQCSVLPGQTNPAEDGDFYQLDAKRHHTVYRWDAIRFTIDIFGTATIRQERTNFEGPLGRTSFRDFDSDGVVDGVMRMMSVYGYNCGHGGCPLVEVSTYSGAEAWTGPGSPQRTIGGLTVSAGHGQFIARHAGTVPDRMLRVTNGLGHRTRWTYRPLSSRTPTDCTARPFGLPPGDSYTPIPFYTAHYSGQARDGVHSLFSSAKSVVSEVVYDSGETDADASFDRSTCYFYEDAWWNNQGRGFLAFGKITEEQRELVNTRDQLRVTTTYETRFPLAGRPLTVQTSTITDPIGDNVYFDRRSANWTYDCSFAGGRPAGEPYAEACFVFNTKDVHELRDLATRTAIGTRIVARTFDPADRTHGNVSQIMTTRQDSQQHTITETFAYDYSGAAAWWIDRVDTVTTSHGQIQDPSLPVSENGKTHRVRFTYYPDGDPAARLVRAAYVQEGKPNEELIAEYSYDLYGNRTSITETASLGGPARTTTLGYAATSGYFLETVTNPLQHVTRHGFDLATGSPLSVVDANQTGVSWQYDTIGRLAQVTATGQRAEHHRVWGCDVSCPEGAVYRTRIVQQGAPTRDLYHDVLGRAVREVHTGFDGVQLVYTSRLYDRRGNVVSQRWPSHDPNASHTTYWEGFDALGRPTRKISGPREERYGYAGLTTTTTHGGVYPGPTRTVTTDLDGRVLQTTDGAGHRVRLRYNPQGLLALTEDPTGVIGTLGYDARGRRTRSGDADQGVHTYDFDGFDQLIKRTDARNTIVRTAYDVLGRPTQRTLDGQQAPLATWTYDRKRLGAVDDETTSNGFARELAYDAAGRIAQLTTTIDGRAFVTDHGYDCRGQLVSIRYPSGKEVGLAYNDRGDRLREEDWGFGTGAAVTLRTIEAMSAARFVERALLANGAREIRGYLPTGELATHKVQTGGGPILDATYLYESALGNLTSRTSGTLGVGETYVYDPANRLESATRTFPSGPPRTVAYAYDAAGRFTSKSDRGGAFLYGTGLRPAPSLAGPSGIQRYTRNGGVTVSDFRYDANGSLLQGDGRTMVYDAVFPVPTSITSGGATVTFAYDPSGDRFKKVEGGATTYYIGHYEHVVHANLDHTMRHAIGGEIVQNIVWPFGSVTGNQTTSFLHTDRLGSLELVTPGTAGELATAISTGTLERHAFDPYGGPRNGDWTDGNGVWSSPTTPRGFTDHEHLGAHELVHMNGRVYDPRLARFTSVDPLLGSPASSQAYTRYGYLLDNPTAGTDPSGLLGKKYYELEGIMEEVIVEAKCIGPCRKRRARPLLPDPALDPWHRHFLTPQLGRTRVDIERGAQRSIGPATGSPVGRSIVELGLDPVSRERRRNYEGLVGIEAGRQGVVPQAIDPTISAEGSLGSEVVELVGQLVVGVAEAANNHLTGRYERYENGRLVDSGEVTSGGTHPRRSLSWPEQAERHVEAYITRYSTKHPLVSERGVVVHIYIHKAICSHCKHRLKNRSLFGGEYIYHDTLNGTTLYFRDGEQTAQRRGTKRINMISRVRRR